MYKQGDVAAQQESSPVGSAKRISDAANVHLGGLEKHQESNSLYRRQCHTLLNTRRALLMRTSPAHERSHKNQNLIASYKVSSHQSSVKQSPPLTPFWTPLSTRQAHKALFPGGVGRPSDFSTHHQSTSPKHSPTTVLIRSDMMWSSHASFSKNKHKIKNTSSCNVVTLLHSNTRDTFIHGKKYFHHKADFLF